LYYNITPGKEVLTNVLTYAVLYFFYASWSRDKLASAKAIFPIAVLIVLLGLVRLNAALMVVSVLMAYIIVVSNNKIRILLKLSLLFALMAILVRISGLNDLILLITDIDSHVSQLDLRLQNAEAGGLKHVLATTFTSENFFISMILAPFRMIIWLIAPFPFLDLFSLSSNIFFGEYYVVFRSGEALARSLSSVIMVYFCYKCFYCLLLHSSVQKLKPTYFILFVIIGFSLILSTTNFVEGARYRTIIEPLVICWLLATSKANSIANNKQDFTA
jgi:hypothetical protein